MSHSHGATTRTTDGTTAPTAGRGGAAAPADAHRWPLLARIGALAVGTFVVDAIVVGLLNPGYNPVREGVSALAATNADYAWLMIAGFLAQAVGLVCTGVLLWRRVGRGKAGRAAAVLVTLTGAGMAVAGLARQDCSERLSSCIDYDDAPLASTHFWVHQYVSMALFLGLIVALFLLARALRRDSGRAHLAVPTRFVAIYCLLTVAAVFIGEIGNAYYGLFQRVFTLLVFGWPVVVAVSASRRSVSETADSVPAVEVAHVAAASHAGHTA
ncbi:MULTISPECIES: DUF998 domain-containing protein [Pseudofrankia]|uniref:DUF998 domain-containing protein n=1 Tax=Pseudofrankia TaxID=2994363 RepID=UPI000234D0A1|nr:MULTISPECIES: DUF998 domain-containing protein [Pseudofrankia]OHV35660.1 hypothetical protein BCD49_22030 [Pseudofrankia sp. EUN1h]